ncbi:hypothetical protein [Paludisphaera mucosa]|uniref:Alpha/beta hydrolase n=1 Tax=Paludisphaera mucosa TaxID=3030827 RepID=A0ABT6F858_9BACT|nr:hypothetical protein [Paludisphaera mucosa]MDG3003719.1 hypothetical protein [Paludisphaera mucosa]
MSILHSWLGLAFLTCVPPDGERIDMAEDAKLFIPSGWHSREGKVDILLHLHGTPTVTEPALVTVGWNAVLVSFNRNGLSAAYSKPFTDPTLFPRLIDETVKAVAARRSAALNVGNVVVSSFSAGFGGVREMLKTPASFDRIDAIVLADSLYCGYAGDPIEKRVDPDLMNGFERYAREAAEGRKAMIVTHSAQVPPGYGSTTETADDLIKVAAVTPEMVDIDWGDSLRQTRRAAKGRFQVLGFSGEGPEDHMRHLRRIAEVWRRLPDSIPGGR